MAHRAPYSTSQSIADDTAFAARYHHPGTQRRVAAFDEGKKLAVVIDGEIFSLKGATTLHNDKIQDAELVLDLYLRKGEAFVDEIDGSYAISIWDGTKQKLLLARDRLGFKPLFYLDVGIAFLFASEIKAILKSGVYCQSVNRRALNYFLSYGYVPNPHTLFNSILQVKPAHVLVLQGGSLSERPYWRLTYNQQTPGKSEPLYIEEFSEILKKAVARRLARNPDCGAFLSGGLDTSAVVAAVREITARPFKVFTGGFKEERYSEFDDAQVVADHLHLEHFKALIEFDDKFPQLLQKLVWHHDAPFADTSAIPSYLTAKLAKKSVDVVLTGDYPDQLIGGSRHHIVALSRQQSDSFLYKLVRNNSVNRLMTSLPISAGTTSLIHKAMRMLYRESFPLEEQRVILGMPVPDLLKPCLYSPEMLAVNAASNPLALARSLYRQSCSQDLLNRILYFDCLSYAPDDLMVKVERMTMAHGLIALSPFHDREFVEFVATIPSHLKIRGGIQKFIMKEAVRPLLPAHTLNKRKKGFDMPIGKWLTDKLSSYVRELLLDQRTLNRQYFNKDFLTKMVDNFLSGKTDYASGSDATIISLITLELWHRIFVDSH